MQTGPSVPDMLRLLGRERALGRLREARARVADVFVLLLH